LEKIEFFSKSKFFLRAKIGQIFFFAFS
jgi:hypothetical protein